MINTHISAVCPPVTQLEYITSNAVVSVLLAESDGPAVPAVITVRRLHHSHRVGLLPRIPHFHCTYTYRQCDRQTDRHHSHRVRLLPRIPHSHCTYTHRQTVWQTNRQTNRQAGRQADRQTDRQTSQPQDLTSAVDPTLSLHLHTQTEMV